MKKKYGDKIREVIYQQELKPVYRSIFTNEIQNILYEAIDQTREEIINKAIDIVSRELYDDNYELCVKINKQIQELNKLKK